MYCSGKSFKSPFVILLSVLAGNRQAESGQYRDSKFNTLSPLAKSSRDISYIDEFEISRLRFKIDKDLFMLGSI